MYNIFYVIFIITNKQFVSPESIYEHNNKPENKRLLVLTLKVL